MYELKKVLIGHDFYMSLSTGQSVSPQLHILDNWYTGIDGQYNSFKEINSNNLRLSR